MLNYLCVLGASGLGKSTLVNSMFLTDIYAAGGKETGKDMSGSTDPDTETQTLRVETHNR